MKINSEKIEISKNGNEPIIPEKNEYAIIEENQDISSRDKCNRGTYL